MPLSDAVCRVSGAHYREPILLRKGFLKSKTSSAQKPSKPMK
jgi:hypothetical protein